MAIQTTVLALCDDLKEYSLDLVDSSEVDDELLDVPIAHADGSWLLFFWQTRERLLLKLDWRHCRPIRRENDRENEG
jgi:hypothetical protein